METVMESSSRRSQGGLRSINYSPRSTSVLQGMLMFVIFTTHFHWAVSKRNESLTVPAPTQGPWNKTLYKIEHQCLDFRSARIPSYFYYWPEDDFDYCCSTIGSFDKPRFSYGGLSFTYGLHGPQLAYATYYDLGPIDQCLPYWKFGCLLPRLYESVLFIVACEYKDLEHLYQRRFWIGTVLNYGLLQSALPLILSLEILVMPFAVLYWIKWGRSGYKLKQVFAIITVKDWFRATRKTLLIDWIHLSLLAIIGNGLLEAMGHENPQTAAVESFYQYSLLYIALTFLVWISSFLQQLSYWVSEIEDHCEYDVLPTHEASRSGCPTYATKQDSHLSRQTSDEATKLKEKIGLDADWKLQPIGAQAGILFCLWAYLTNVGSDGSGLFGLVVAAAGPWSGLYALRVIGTCIYFLVKLRLSIAEKRCRHRQRIRGLWRRVIHLEKWRGARGDGYEAELTNSAQPDKLLLHEGKDRV
ncbi:hypothetical protein KC19_2G248800 [Ceratodon purpureus]|uniref:Uncharacterized protein n=1 Tax=Ceratodon purpureus TaxID=3225 RepID=A0A8T0J1F1_CERPU|nr:hypothetical protein KC19_2G248800 [Ceratodon purpureus]